MAKAKSKSAKYSEIDFADDVTIARDYWWLLLIRGIALALFGLMAVIWPGITFVVLSYMFALYLIAVGVIDTVVGARSIKTSSLWFLRILLGIAELGIGVYLINQGTIVTVAAFILLIGVFFLFQGLVEIVTSFRNSHDLGSKFWHIFSGFLAILVGMIVLRQPVSGGIAFTWVLGFYGLFGGALGISYALSLRKANKQ